MSYINEQRANIDDEVREMSIIELRSVAVKALTKLGCPPHLLQSVSNLGQEKLEEPSLEISLDNIPSIYVSLINEEVWVWSALPYLKESDLMQKDSVAGELCIELLKSIKGLATNVAVLGLGDGGYELKGLVHKGLCTHPDKLSEVLELFYQLCERIHKRFAKK